MIESVVAYDGEVSEDVGSFNHSYLQSRLVVLLSKQEEYTVCTELSLDISKLNLDSGANEIRPDLCLYPRRKMSKPQDIIRMAEMPLLVVEILSPKQGTYDILEKFRIYFAAGVKSCWLVEPTLEAVVVYASMRQYEHFFEGEMFDKVMNIRLSIREIFD